VQVTDLPTAKKALVHFPLKRMKKVEVPGKKSIGSKKQVEPHFIT
jgi:hypothetical protein